jgi:hypothetical protein
MAPSYFEYQYIPTSILRTYGVIGNAGIGYIRRTSLTRKMGGIGRLTANCGEKRKGRREKEGKGKKGERRFLVPSGESSFLIVHAGARL